MGLKISSSWRDIALPLITIADIDWSDAYLKLAGCLLLISGWLIVLVALALLPAFAARATFIAAGVAVEILGLALIARGQVTEQKQKQALKQSIGGTGGYR